METELQTRLSAELWPGERLLWAGRPRTINIVFHLASWILLACVWMYFIGGFNPSPGAAANYDRNKDVVFATFLAAWVLLYFAARLGTYYALTDRRALVLCTTLPPRILYIDWADSKSEPIPIRRGIFDGIRFGRLAVNQDRFSLAINQRPPRYLRFSGLEDLDTVYETARRAQDNFLNEGQR